MRRLLLLRHSKAAPYAGPDDHGRALTESGRDDARQIGELIATRGLIPDIVIHSSASRTRETAAIAASRWPKSTRLVEEDGLYEATRAMILMVARALPDDAAVAMIVGHNPGISDLANWLTGDGGEDDRLRMAAKFPTSGLAALDFPQANWAEIEPRTARLLRFFHRADSSLGRA
jgi:phosphohistidine phosphatase